MDTRTAVQTGWGSEQDGSGGELWDSGAGAVTGPRAADAQRAQAAQVRPGPSGKLLHAKEMHYAAWVFLGSLSYG